MEYNESELSLETLLHETLMYTQMIRENAKQNHLSFQKPVQKVKYPETVGIIYKIDNFQNTFCIRGFISDNIKLSMESIQKGNKSDLESLKINTEEEIKLVNFFPTKTKELAGKLREQTLNRRFPHQEDSICNLSDPGFSWWMNYEESIQQNIKIGKFEVFFKSHDIFRAEKYDQLGPIGSGAYSAIQLNNARNLLLNSFPISEFSCDDKSLVITTTRPDHSSFLTFKKIFSEGINYTERENFPEDNEGDSLYNYFQEVALIRRFWIEVKSKIV